MALLGRTSRFTSRVLRTQSYLNQLLVTLWMGSTRLASLRSISKIETGQSYPLWVRRRARRWQRGEHSASIRRQSAMPLRSCWAGGRQEAAANSLNSTRLSD